MSKFLFRTRKPCRLKNWNYASEGLYFITINTKHGKNYFGEVVDGHMVLNDIGREVENQWLATPSIRKDLNITLDELQVMPNHFHGIIGIGANQFNFCQTNIRGGNKFGPQVNNLGSILRGFKSSVTSWCNKQNLLFGWHVRYNDKRIRDERALDNIRKYIRNNPMNWHRDRFYGGRNLRLK